MNDQGGKTSGALAVRTNLRWWVLGGVVVAVVLGIGIVLSVQVVSQTGALEATANNPAIAPNLQADLVRNAYQYQSDGLTKIWTAIIGSLTGVAAALVAYVGWQNYQGAKRKMEADRKVSEQNFQIAQDNLQETRQKIEDDRKVSENNFLIAQQNLEQTRRKMDADKKASDDNLKIAQQAQITDRFTRAIDQLGSENIEIRLGGIYALEKIAQDDPPGYHWTIIEILTAYVRENARWRDPPASDSDVSPSDGQAESQSPSTDIRATLTVILRRDRSHDRRGGHLDLSGTDLRQADLGKSHLENTNLEDAHLERADLSEAHLERVNLRGAHLENADFRFAHLQGADLGGAYLENAELGEAQLQGTSFRLAHLASATLTEAHLERAVLWKADLQEADLSDAYLEGAHLGDAYLKDTDLTGAHLERTQRLTQAQVFSAIDHGEGAILPPDWPPNWRDECEKKSAEQPLITPSISEQPSVTPSAE
jgi:hypothetical protein